MAQLVKNPPAMWETRVRSLRWEDPWRRERLPTPAFWPRLQRVGHDWTSFTFTFQDYMCVYCSFLHSHIYILLLVTYSLSQSQYWTGDNNDSWYQSSSPLCKNMLGLHPPKKVLPLLLTPCSKGPHNVWEKLTLRRVDNMLNIYIFFFWYYKIYTEASFSLDMLVSASRIFLFGSLHAGCHQVLRMVPSLCL